MMTRASVLVRGEREPTGTPGLLTSYALAAISVVLLSAACEEEDTAGRPPIFSYDSSGVQVIMHRREALSEVPKWQLAPSAEARIGESAEREDGLLFRVAGGGLLGDSTIVIANGGTRELRFYRRNGDHLFTVGGRGGGPGEFTAIDWVGIRPDGAVAVWDSFQRRITSFDASGKLLEVVAVDGDWGIKPPGMIGVLSDFSIVLKQARPISDLVNSPDGETRDSVIILRYTPDGREYEQIAKAPGREIAVGELDGFRGPLRIPFGRDTHATITGSHVVVGTSDEFQIWALDSHGRPVRIISFDYETVPATADAIEAARQQYIDSAAMFRLPEPIRKIVAERVRNLPSRKTLPAFSDLRGDRVGNLWVAGSSLPGAAHVPWYIFNKDGRLRATLQIPADLRILDLTSDQILTLREDELGVEIVELFRIDHT